MNLPFLLERRLNACLMGFAALRSRRELKASVILEALT